MTARLSIALSVLSFLWMSSVSFAEDEQLQKYKDIWDAQRPKLKSGIIRYMYWNGGHYEVNDHDSVNSLFHTITDNRHDYPAMISDLECTLAGVKAPLKPPIYPEVTLYYDGKKQRAERMDKVDIYDGISSIETRNQVNNTSLQIIMRDHQVDGNRQINGLSEFYSIPEAGIADKLFVASALPDADRLEIVPRTLNRIDGFSMFVAKNGDVLEIYTGLATKGNSSEEVRSAFKEFRGGVRLPQLIFSGRYNDGKLTSATVLAIVDADFSTTIDDNVFCQNAKAGDVIIDLQNGGRVFRPEHDIEDVTKEVPWRAN